MADQSADGPQRAKAERYGRVVQEFSKKAGTRTAVVRDVSDLPAFLQQDSRLSDPDVTAFYHEGTDTIYLFPDRIQSEAELVEALAHEALQQGIAL